MRISAVLPVVFAAATYADLAAVQAAFATINTNLATFDTAILALTPGTIPVDALTAKSQAVVSALNSGTTIVQAIAPVSLQDALTLFQSAESLVTGYNKTVTDLTSQQSVFSAANLNGFVVTQLQGQRAAGQAFIAAAVSRLPQFVQSAANQQAQAAITSMEKGITAFGGSLRKMRFRG
jgi:Hydrophobic surface binding protein A